MKKIVTFTCRIQKQPKDFDYQTYDTIIFGEAYLSVGKKYVEFKCRFIYFLFLFM